MFNYNWQKRVVAATPMISLLLFLVFGFFFNAWHPGWTVFFLVPLMPFFVGLKKIRITFSLVVLVIYIILGVTLKIWHPGWIIFLLIPIYHTITFKDPTEKIKEKFNNK